MDRYVSSNYREPDYVRCTYRLHRRNGRLSLLMLRSSDNEEMVDLDIDPDNASRVGTLINERLDG